MSKRHYWNECPNCGAALDPGERCDCERENAAGVDSLMERMNARQIATLYGCANRIYCGSMPLTVPRKTRERIYAELGLT